MPRFKHLFAESGAVALEITRIKTTEFSFPVEDTANTPGSFSPAYAPGETLDFEQYGIKIETDEGVTGEYIGGSSPALAQVNNSDERDAIDDGTIDVPSGPGLGVEYDWGSIYENEAGGRVYE